MPPTEFTPLMTAYFAAEKRESLFFLLAGIVALASSAAVYKSGGAYRAMIWPLALVGLVQVAVGASVFLRTDGQVRALTAQLAEAPPSAKRDETARMQRVMTSFRVYEAIEIVVLAAGVVLALTFGRGAAWHAVGIGCIAQGSVMLVLDLVAEGRGKAYLEALARLS